MISLVDDAEEQLYWKQIYNENKHKEETVLKSMLEGLTNNDFSNFSQTSLLKFYKLKLNIHTQM